MGQFGERPFAAKESFLLYHWCGHLSKRLFLPYLIRVKPNDPNRNYTSLLRTLGYRALIDFFLSDLRLYQTQFRSGSKWFVRLWMGNVSEAVCS